jgi:hypothetical protein
MKIIIMLDAGLCCYPACCCYLHHYSLISLCCSLIISCYYLSCSCCSLISCCYFVITCCWTVVAIDRELLLGHIWKCPKRLQLLGQFD